MKKKVTIDIATFNGLKVEPRRGATYSEQSAYVDLCIDEATNGEVQPLSHYVKKWRWSKPTVGKFIRDLGKNRKPLFEPKNNTNGINKNNNLQKSSNPIRKPLFDTDKYYKGEEFEEAWLGYVEMRNKIRKPLTNRAAGLALKKLKDLCGYDAEKAAKVLDQSTLKGWQGLFPLPEDKRNGKVIEVIDEW